MKRHGDDGESHQPMKQAKHGHDDDESELSRDYGEQEISDSASLEAKIVRYQKKAIWLQMQQYKDINRLTQQDLDRLTSDTKRYQQDLRFLCQVSDIISESLKCLVDSSVDETSTSLMVAALEESLMTEDQRKANVDEIRLRFLQSTGPTTRDNKPIEECLSDRWLLILTLIRTIFAGIAAKKLLAGTKLDELLAQQVILHKQIASLQTQNNGYEASINQLTDRLEAMRHSVAASEKKLNRFKIMTMAEVAKQQQLLNKQQQMQKEVVPAAHIPSAETPKHMVAEDELVEAQHRAELRLSEMENLKLERLDMVNDINGLRLQVCECLVTNRDCFCNDWVYSWMKLEGFLVVWKS